VAGTPRVDFYILADSGSEARLRFVCRLVDKAYQQGHRIYVHTGAADVSVAMNDLLWTYRQDSFVPHAILGSEAAEEVPVCIGHSEAPQARAGLLVNLGPDIPSFFEHYDRVVEVVTQDEATRAAARAHYRHYRDHGCHLESHDLRGR
jgi:DNA polymerase-3 subunit chi